MDAEKELANEYLIRGQEKLLLEEKEGINLLKQAEELDPENAYLFFNSGLSLYEYGLKDEKAMYLSSKKFEKAVALDPEYCEAFHMWGNALIALGNIYDEQHHLYDAKEKLAKAITIAEKKALLGRENIYWDYGKLWMEIAEQSGEPLDLQLAVQAFEQTLSLQQTLPIAFWHDFGNVSLKLAPLINDLKLFSKAIHCFKQAISLSSSHVSWYLLAQALRALHNFSHDQEHFSQANDCFTTATEICVNDLQVWVEWASFLCESGQRHQNSYRLRQAIEKCHKILEIDPTQPVAYSIWAESLALLGELTDRLDLIHEAQNKAAEAVNLAPELPEMWHSYGLCFISLAIYFQDSEHYYHAIEKFQCGLSLDRSQYALWHTVAKTYIDLAELEKEPDYFERASRFFQKAYDLHSCNEYAIDLAHSLAKYGEIENDPNILERSLKQYEQILNTQKNAIYLHPDWLFQYAHTLNLFGNLFDDSPSIEKGVEIFNHVLMIDPEFPQIHHHLALSYACLGDLKDDIEIFYKANHHFRLAQKHEGDNEQIIVDWGITLIDIAERITDQDEIAQLYRDAENKLIVSAKLGSPSAYYYLGCLYSILGERDKAMAFLQKAHQFEGLPSTDALLHDEWLENVRETDAFQNFVSRLAQ